jgi:hypothetical protein
MAMTVYNIDPDGPVELDDVEQRGECPRCGRDARHRRFDDATGGSVNTYNQVHCEHCNYHDDGGWTP